jgi:hypothetical protein
MAFAAVGTVGSRANKTANQASSAITLTADANAGNLIVVAIAVDNNATTDQDENAITSITDSAGGNTWTEVAEFTNSDAAAQAGTVGAAYYSVLTNTISSGGTITVNFSNSTSRDASAITCHEFTKGAGTNVAVFTGSLTANAQEFMATATYPIPGDGTTELLRIFVNSSESNAATENLTQTWGTAMTHATTTGGGAAGNVFVRAFFAINSNATHTFQYSSPGDVANGNAQVGIAFGLFEAAGATNKTITIDKPSSLTLRRTVGPRMVVMQDKTPVLIRSVLHRMLIAQPKTATALKTIRAARAVSAISQAKAVTVTRLKSKVQLLNLQQSKAATLLRAAGKDVFISQGKDVVLQRSVRARIAIAQAKAVTLLRAAARRLVVAQSKVVTTARTFIPGGGDTFPQIINITQAKSAAVVLLRTVLSILEVAQGKAVTLRRSISDRIIISQAKAAVLRQSIGRRIAVAQAKTLTISALKAFTRNITIAQAKAVTLARRLAASRLISVAQTKTVTLRRAAARVLRITQGKAVIISTGGLLFTRTVNIAQAKALLLRKNYAKVFTISAAKTIAIIRLIRTRLLISQGKTPQLIRAMSRRILVAQGKAVAIARVRTKLAVIAISQSKLVTLFQAFIAGTPARTTTSARGQPQAPTRRPFSTWRRPGNTS